MELATLGVEEAWPNHEGGVTIIYQPDTLRCGIAMTCSLKSSNQSNVDERSAEAKNAQLSSYTQQSLSQRRIHVTAPVPPW